MIKFVIAPTQHNEATLLPVSDYAESGCKGSNFFPFNQINPFFLLTYSNKTLNLHHNSFQFTFIKRMRYIIILRVA